MLKGIDPLLGPELLAILRAMGHGDSIALVDANFPAEANARRLVRADGVDAIRMVRAVLSVLPLDDFEPVAAYRMAIVDAPGEVPPIAQEFDAALRTAGYSAALAPLDRHDFYQRARACHAIVATGETRLYGNLILVKGVIHTGGEG
jgi:L-fucose mutarotase